MRHLHLIEYIMSSFLLLLNKYILTKFLIEWLDAKELSKLDTSLDKKARLLLTSLLIEFRDKFEVVYSSLPEIKLSVGLILSAYARGLPISNGGVICESFLSELTAGKKSLFEFWEKPRVAIPPDIAHHLRKLKILHIFNCPDHLIPTLGTVLSLCSNVEEIHFITSNSLENIVRVVSETYTSLRKVNIVGNLSKLKLSSIRLLLTNCKVRDLKLDSDEKLSGTNVNTAITRFLTEYPELLEIEMMPTYCRDFELGANLKTLLSLRCDCFTDATFNSFLVQGGGSQLTSLDVSWCGAIRASSSVNIGSYCPQLTDLSVALISIHQSNFELMMTPLVALKSFHALPAQYILTDRQANFVADTVYKHCPLIESMSAHFSLSLVNYPLLTDMAINGTMDMEFRTVMETIGSQLRRLTIRKPSPYSDYGHEESIDYCPIMADQCRNLRSLRLNDWYLLPSTAYYLACSLQLLEDVGLHVKEESELVVHFLQQCPLIRQLRLQCSVAMPEQEWDKIINLSGKLREFHLKLKSHHKKDILMNPNVMRRMLTKGKRLRLVKSRGCHWNVWSIRLFEEELQKIKPDCRITMFSLGMGIPMPS